jgi:hypothetical protein
LDHGIEYPFEDISNPKKQVDKILQLKGRFTVPVPEEDKELE